MWVFHIIVKSNNGAGGSTRLNRVGCVRSGHTSAQLASAPSCLEKSTLQTPHAAQTIAAATTSFTFSTLLCFHSTVQPCRYPSSLTQRLTNFIHFFSSPIASVFLLSEPSHVSLSGFSKGFFFQLL